MKNQSVTPFSARHGAISSVAVSADFERSPETGVNPSVPLTGIANKITDLPADKAFNRKLIKLMQDRKASDSTRRKTDWAMGEPLAYAHCCPTKESRKAQRPGFTKGNLHTVMQCLLSKIQSEKYTPLKNIKPDCAPFDIYNSPLSEYGVLGFDYGYSPSFAAPLTIWGSLVRRDFFNGA
ncbi:MAG: hypothetical protein IPH20_25115 [Bacteroidales bacterium]|nr:hypothetical protein [Bacteroidales bacterium]